MYEALRFRLLKDNGDQNIRSCARSKKVHYYAVFELIWKIWALSPITLYIEPVKVLFVSYSVALIKYPDISNIRERKCLLDSQFQVTAHHCRRVSSRCLTKIITVYPRSRAKGGELMHSCLCSDHFPYLHSSGSPDWGMVPPTVDRSSHKLI